MTFQKIAPADWELNPGQRRGDALLAGPQRHTLLVGGSRSGKTTLFVNAILVRAHRAPGSRHAILRSQGNAARSSIALDTLPKVARMRFPSLTLTEHRQDGFFSIPNGSEIWIGGLDEKDRVDKILGKEYATIFINECSQVTYRTVLTVQTRLAQVSHLNDGSILKQRMYYDLNPVGRGHWSNTVFGDKRDPISRQMLSNPEEYARLFINPKDNADNLTQEYLDSLSHLPERQRKRFWEGLYVDELDNALWTYELIEETRVEEFDPEKKRRTVVAVDPSGAANKDDEARDEIGIIVACLGDDGHGYVLADRSLRDSPANWARAAIQAYHDFGADSIIAEQNFGGEMVRTVILAADPNVPVRLMTASRGKSVRAEPIAALYEKKWVHHVGRFGTLEDQLVAFTASGYRGEASPDHGDACVWALTELMLGSSAEAWMAYFDKMAQATKKDDDKPKRRGVKKEEPPPESSAVDAYKRVTGKATAKIDREDCPWCGERVIGTRTTDGEDSYHEDCYHAMVKAARVKTKAAQ